MRHPRLTIVFALLLLIGLTGGASATTRPGVFPVAIHIEHANVLAPVVVAHIDNGTPEELHCESAVSYYEESGRLGVAGNMFMAGANNWFEHGETAVFAQLKNVQNGDAIEIGGEDGKIYRFEVVKLQEYPNSSEAPLAEIFGTPKNEKFLTIVTPAGAVDEASGNYVGVLVVQAKRTHEKPFVPTAPSMFAGLTADPACLAH